MKAKAASELVQVAGHDHLETLRRCGGYYCCPKDAAGNRLGPLVGYAGKYDAPDGPKQWVGDIYANFARAEPFDHVMRHFAGQLTPQLVQHLDRIDFFCGAPLGGYSFAQTLGGTFDRRVIKAEKKVTALQTGSMREQSTVVFGRHEIERGARVAIVEDVCNNFSTTNQLIALIEKCEGEVVTIVCLLNRSLKVDDFYVLANNYGRPSLPVVSLVRLPIPEYRQDDAEVASDIARGNVVLKPKDRWGDLMDAMARAAQV